MYENRKGNPRRIQIPNQIILPLSNMPLPHRCCATRQLNNTTFHPNHLFNVTLRNNNNKKKEYPNF